MSNIMIAFYSRAGMHSVGGDIKDPPVGDAEVAASGCSFAPRGGRDQDERI